MLALSTGLFFGINYAIGWSDVSEIFLFLSIKSFVLSFVCNAVSYESLYLIIAIFIGILFIGSIIALFFKKKVAIIPIILLSIDSIIITGIIVISSTSIKDYLLMIFLLPSILGIALCILYLTAQKNITYKNEPNANNTI